MKTKTYVDPVNVLTLGIFLIFISLVVSVSHSVDGFLVIGLMYLEIITLTALMVLINGPKQKPRKLNNLN